MKKIRFYLNKGNVHGNIEDIIEFEDDATGEEIQEAFDDWLNNLDMGWHEIED